MYFFKNKKQMASKATELVHKIVKEAAEIGMSHLNIEGGAFTGKEKVKNSSDEFTNFSLCDYLGLSTDMRIRQAASDAIMHNGVYSAVSRTYMKLEIYEKAEKEVSECLENL